MQDVGPIGSSVTAGGSVLYACSPGAFTNGCRMRSQLQQFTYQVVTLPSILQVTGTGLEAASQRSHFLLSLYGMVWPI